MPTDFKKLILFDALKFGFRTFERTSHFLFHLPKRHPRWRLHTLDQHRKSNQTIWLTLLRAYSMVTRLAALSFAQIAQKAVSIWRWLGYFKILESKSYLTPNYRTLWIWTESGQTLEIRFSIRASHYVPVFEVIGITVSDRSHSPAKRSPVSQRVDSLDETLKARPVPPDRRSVLSNAFEPVMIVTSSQESPFGA